jgi:hypothetical protein
MWVRWYRFKRDKLWWTKEYKLRVSEWDKIKQTNKLMVSMKDVIGLVVKNNKKESEE